MMDADFGFDVGSSNTRMKTSYSHMGIMVAM